MVIVTYCVKEPECLLRTRHCLAVWNKWNEGYVTDNRMQLASWSQDEAWLQAPRCPQVPGVWSWGWSMTWACEGQMRGTGVEGTARTGCRPGTWLWPQAAARGLALVCLCRLPASSAEKQRLCPAQRSPRSIQWASGRVLQPEKLRADF